MSDTTKTMEALRAALYDFREYQSEIDALTASQNEARDTIKTLLIEAGGKVAIKGLASASIVPASTSHSYDTKMIDDVILRAIADGDMQTASALTAARKETTRRETLRIVQEKAV
ncbi:hypothetical protein UFOVP698_40 [uncultured Caudovirales phage]|uniref:Uncharacterized protein n=1 Tax=uncultured Caudovirales phage TaxID=2100421 RepID=A0A6J5NPG4_9CAUD|nr:hypothetical protein UFOVP698_40 [uncultured Caudovirales phage]